jgi:hypothetical protein
MPPEAGMQTQFDWALHSAFSGNDSQSAVIPQERGLR